MSPVRSRFVTFRRRRRLLKRQIQSRCNKRADERRDNKQPQLIRRPSSNKDGGPNAARRVDRSVGDGNAYEVEFSRTGEKANCNPPVGLDRDICVVHILYAPHMDCGRRGV
jgi:hypothetical protein